MFPYTLLVTFPAVKFAVTSKLPVMFAPAERFKCPACKFALPEA